ncbi:MAG: hypothetical protein WC624_06300 [Candidatus Margulisiibacteriota bacterium]
MSGLLDRVLIAAGTKQMPKAQTIGSAIAAVKAKAEQSPPPAVACETVAPDTVHCRPTLGPRNDATTLVIKGKEVYVPSELVATSDAGTSVRYIDSALDMAGLQRDGKSKWDSTISYYRVPVKDNPNAVDVTVEDNRAQAEPPAQSQ